MSKTNEDVKKATPPCISIIVPIYKVEQYLNKCIDSIIAQTFTDFELILVDDGSTDNCGAICDEYVQKDKRISVIHQDNQGISMARNNGIDIARGQYILFVDSDDDIYEDMVELLYRLLVKNKADMSCCYFNIIEKGIIKSDQKEIIEKTVDPQGFLRAYYKKDVSIAAWGKLYKKEIFERCRYTKGMLAEDLYIILDVLGCVDIIAYTTDRKYNYLIRDDGIMMGSGMQLIKDWLEGENKKLDIVTQKYPEIVKETEVNYIRSIICMVKKLIKKKELKDGRKYIDHSVHNNINKWLKNDTLKIKLRLTLFTWKIKPDLFYLVLKILIKMRIIK